MSEKGLFLAELGQASKARGILPPLVIREEEDGTIFLVAAEVASGQPARLI